MKITIPEALEMIERHETPEQYGKRIRRLRRLANERDALEDAIEVLEGDEERRGQFFKKKKRLEVVKREIEALK